MVTAVARAPSRTAGNPRRSVAMSGKGQLASEVTGIGRRYVSAVATAGGANA